MCIKHIGPIVVSRPYQYPHPALTDHSAAYRPSHRDRVRTAAPFHTPTPSMYGYYSRLQTYQPTAYADNIAALMSNTLPDTTKFTYCCY